MSDLDSKELEVTDFRMRPGKIELTAEMGHELAIDIAWNMAELWRVAGSKDDTAHLRWKLDHPELGKLEMVMRRLNEGAPEAVAERRKAERDEARVEAKLLREAVRELRHMARTRQDPDEMVEAANAALEVE